MAQENGFDKYWEAERNPLIKKDTQLRRVKLDQILEYSIRPAVYFTESIQLIHSILPALVAVSHEHVIPLFSPNSKFEKFSKHCD